MLQFRKINLLTGKINRVTIDFAYIESIEESPIERQNTNSIGTKITMQSGAVYFADTDYDKVQKLWQNYKNDWNLPDGKSLFERVFGRGYWKHK